MINSKTHRATWMLCKTVNSLSSNVPCVKVALIKKQYTQKADENNNIPTLNSAWSSTRPEWLLQLENLLRYTKLDSVRTALAACAPPGKTEKKTARMLYEWQQELQTLPAENPTGKKQTHRHMSRKSDKFGSLPRSSAIGGAPSI